MHFLVESASSFYENYEPLCMQDQFRALLSLEIVEHQRDGYYSDPLHQSQRQRQLETFRMQIIFLHVTLYTFDSLPACHLIGP